MKAVVVEDEFVAAQSLQRLIAQIDDSIEVLTVLQSVEESVDWFSENPSPDLVFMDIHLADGSSFSIFDKVEIKCPIIFTTAYDEYSLKAFEVNSIDYLLKPISKDNLERALVKLENLTAKQDNMSQVAEMLASLQSKPKYKTHFLIPHKDKLLPLAVDQIAYIFSEYKMAKIVLNSQQSFVIDSSLDEISKQLDPDLFFRANRQFIVAHKAINDMSQWFNGKLSVNLAVPTPERIIVSRARISEFKSWYTQ